MAQMYPNSLNPDTESRAERQLYNEFKNNLPDNYLIFHSVAWQSKSSRTGAKDGEADFIIIHPEKGILVVEAKSGKISFDGHRGIWFQNNHTMKDPFEQAKRSRYHLKSTLDEIPGWESRNIVFGQAVAFPDVIYNYDSITMQSPKVLILDKQDIFNNLKGWVDSVFDHYGGTQNKSSISKYGIEILINLLAPIRELRSLMGVEIHIEESEFVRLTSAQYKTLDFLAWQSRVAIAGCAGSGKTMLAAEKARRLANQGWRVLLTCFNVNLANFLREDYLAGKPDNLEINNFHKVATNLISQSGQQVKHFFHDDEDKQNYFKKEIPDYLITAIEKLGSQYDAIIVDEAQDFLENWWLPLQMLLEEPYEGTFYIFYDDNQNIYGGLKHIKNLAQGFPLLENCRNTKTIHHMVQHFYNSDHSIEALGPEGREINIVSYTSTTELSKALRTTLHKLLIEEEVDPADVVILTPRNLNSSNLSQLGALGRFRLTTNWNINDNEVYYGTIHSFKGLESPVIILAELEEEDGFMSDELIYVGCSRARNHLVVICHQNTLSRFDT